MVRATIALLLALVPSAVGQKTPTLELTFASDGKASCRMNGFSMRAAQVAAVIRAEAGKLEDKRLPKLVVRCAGNADVNALDTFFHLLAVSESASGARRIPVTELLLKVIDCGDPVRLHTLDFKQPSRTLYLRTSPKAATKIEVATESAFRHPDSVIVRRERGGRVRLKRGARFPAFDTWVKGLRDGIDGPVLLAIRGEVPIAAVVPLAHHIAKRYGQIVALTRLTATARPKGAGGAFGRRRGGQRSLRAVGGGGKAQRAVERGLEWLQRHQQADGSWKAPSRERVVLLTALASLGYLGSGSTHASGPYKDVLWGALAALEQRQGQDGRFGGPKSELAHVVATLALAEAFGVSKDEVWRKPAQRGLDALKTVVEGGIPKGTVGWTALALTAGEASRLMIDPAVKGTVRAAATSDSGEALFARILLGDKDRAALEKAGDRVLGRPPIWKPDEIDYHRWHFATYAMFQLGGDRWKRWNVALSASLRDHQCLDKGPSATALGVLTMEVYYRYGRVLPW